MPIVYILRSLYGCTSICSAFIAVAVLHYLRTHLYVWANNYRGCRRVYLYCRDEYSLNVLSGKQIIRWVAGLLIDNSDSELLG